VALFDPSVPSANLHVSQLVVRPFLPPCTVDVEAENVFGRVVFGGAIVTTKPAWMIWLLISDGGEDPAMPPLCERSRIR